MEMTLSSTDFQSGRIMKFQSKKTVQKLHYKQERDKHSNKELKRKEIAKKNQR